MWSTACRTEAAPVTLARSSSETWVGRRRAIANSVATKNAFARTSASVTASSNAIAPRLSREC
jgi:hypothetical protein